MNTSNDKTDQAIVRRTSARNAARQHNTSFTLTTRSRNNKQQQSTRPRRAVRDKPRQQQESLLYHQQPQYHNNNKKNSKSPRHHLQRTCTQFLHDPHTGQPIYTSHISVTDVYRAIQTRRAPYTNQRLVQLNSPTARRDCVYTPAANALTAWEQDLLPPYGGRHWQVHVTVTDNNNKKKKQSPYCIWHNGNWQLATWWYLLDRIPPPPKFAGYTTQTTTSNPTTTTDDDDESVDATTTALFETPWSSLAQVAWEQRHVVPLPTITTKWISPDTKHVYHTRKSAWEHAQQLCKQEAAIEKIYKRMSRKRVLQIGQWRFQRDGLWVIGQEEKEKEPNNVCHKQWSPLAYYLHTQRKSYQQERLQQQQQISLDATEKNK